MPFFFRSKGYYKNGILFKLEKNKYLRAITIINLSNSKDTIRPIIISHTIMPHAM